MSSIHANVKFSPVSNESNTKKFLRNHFPNLFLPSSFSIKRKGRKIPHRKWVYEAIKEIKMYLTSRIKDSVSVRTDFVYPAILQLAILKTPIDQSGPRFIISISKIHTKSYTGEKTRKLKEPLKYACNKGGRNKLSPGQITCKICNSLHSAYRRIIKWRAFIKKYTQVTLLNK